MLSRVADAIYWCSRYVERAENVARFVKVNLNLMLETPVGRRDDWEPLVLTTGDQEMFWKHNKEATPENVAWFLTFDAAYPNSILSALTRARENAQTVREIISREMWQVLNEFYLSVREASKRSFSIDDMASFYDNICMVGANYEGVSSATLSRGEAWYWSRLGRLLERADKTSRILDVKYYILLPTVTEVGTSLDQVGWQALLESASALQMYRQHYHVTNPENVMRFLLFNRAFPRAIHYCIGQAQESLHAITGTPIGDAQGEAERVLGKLRGQLAYDRPEDVLKHGMHEYIDALQMLFNDVSGAIQKQFFEYAP
ncbi:MAG TPA: alpha-E domain-containing protein [Polyangiaceae bacterium]|jgi:uncharacterized alpha-E superfamily protein|nr:alpha-E domain-containing protein [Polyangiaceae bacterium]